MNIVDPEAGRLLLCSCPDLSLSRGGHTWTVTGVNAAHFGQHGFLVSFSGGSKPISKQNPNISKIINTL